MTPVTLNMAGIHDTYSALAKEQYAKGQEVVIQGFGPNEFHLVLVYARDTNKEVLSTSEHWFGGTMNWDVRVIW